MQGQTIIIGHNRHPVHNLIDAAPLGAIVNVKQPRRTLDQNAKFWAMLSDVSRQCEHNGRKFTPDDWKALFMHACEHEVRFILGLNGEPFPVGFRSSKLSKGQMADLITFILQWGDEQGVCWSDEAKQ